MSPEFPHSQPAAAHSTAVRAGKQQLCIWHSHQDTTRLAELERHRCPLVSPLPISGSHSAGSPCFGFSCTEFLSQQHRGAQHPKHRIIKDGKDLLRSSSPTINPSPLCSLNLVPQCHIYTFLENLQGRCLHHFPGQPVPMPYPVI